MKYMAKYALYAVAAIVLAIGLLPLVGFPIGEGIWLTLYYYGALFETFVVFVLLFIVLSIAAVLALFLLFSGNEDKYNWWFMNWTGTATLIGLIVLTVFAANYIEKSFQEEGKPSRIYPISYSLHPKVDLVFQKYRLGKYDDAPGSMMELERTKP